MRATIVNDGRKIGLILLDEYLQIIVRVVNGGGFTNVTDVACDTTKAPTLPECTTLTLVTGAAPLSYLWADKTHLSAGGQQALGSLGIARAQNNPF
jgi:phospholipase/lecithinase/hemolysin